MTPKRIQVTRREFLKSTATTSAALSVFSFLPAVRGANSPSNQVRIAAIGTSRNPSGGDGRGTELAVGFAALPGVRVAYVCDVDARNVPKAIESVTTKARQEQPPKGERDLRRVLDDRDVDAVVIATPDHWHSPAAILACSAGKHVYVEKPCSHNGHEGEMLVAAARKHKRVVQHGTQRRSWPGIREAVDKIRSGAIGPVLFAKAWYYGPRPTIGKGKSEPVPSWLDFDLWQGPAPVRPFRDNLLHYNWHWFWHWGTGELGNNGVHMIDLCRWALGVDYPLRVTSSGGKYRFPEDDQETPDTNVVSFDYGRSTINWEQRSWTGKSSQDAPAEVAFYGQEGVLTINGGGYAIWDLKGKEVSKGSGPAGNQVHLQNFIDTVRGGASLNAEIEEGHKSALLCHLGNIAYRTGQTIQFDQKNRTMQGSAEAKRLWKREYRKGWEPKV